MRDQEFRVKDKKVQKMTRDGLNEQNLTQGTRQRISSRLADVSFEREKLQDTITDAGIGRQGQKKVKQKAAGIQGRESTELKETIRFADASAPEVWGPKNAPVSMRDAQDIPALHDDSHGKEDSLSGQGEKKGYRQKTEAVTKEKIQAQNTKLTKNHTQPCIPENGRLHFGNEEIQKPDTKSRKGSKKRQTLQFAADNAKMEAAASAEPEIKAEVSTALRYEYVDTKKTAEKNHTAMKKAEKRRQALQFAADDAKLQMTKLKEPGMKVEISTALQHGHLQFAHKDTKNMAGKGRVTMKKKLAVKFTANAANPQDDLLSAPDIKSSNVLDLEQEKISQQRLIVADDEGVKMRRLTKSSIDAGKSEHAPRLLFETEKVSPVEHADIETQKDILADKKKTAVKSGQCKKYEKAQRRLENAEIRLENARQKLPERHCVRLRKQCSSENGKAHYRLYFEREVISQYEKPLLPKRAIQATEQIAQAATVRKVHQKIHETERDNVGIEVAHKMETVTEREIGRFLRQNKHRLHEKTYREIHRAEILPAKAGADMEYQKLLKDRPELQKKVYAKWIQKQKIKKKYAAAAREARKDIQHTTNVLNTAGQVVRALEQNVASNKAVLGIVAIGILILSVFGSLFSSCSAMLSGIQSAVVSTCYVAEDTEINASELRYTELETDLQIDINHTETDYPGYDEYRYVIGDIGHNPYELMGYLSAVYDDFTYVQVEAELSRLFALQYGLTREEAVETRTYTDDEGEEHEYEWHILKTNLSVRSLTEIIGERLAAGDQTDRYVIYMQTCGNRQCYGNPLGFAWISHVTSSYGYRVHPISGEKNLHRGIDIGVAEGTPVLAVQDGYVVSAGNAGDYGLCVVVEGEDGYQSGYAHCSSFCVSAGQEVKRGDVIAAVGNTGSSTGAHLHLEITHNGEYLNPYYYVDSGGNGYLPGGGLAADPDFADDPGAAMGDSSFAAMLEEAEKYLGYPYMWGGSSPATSFDCSGYVSWVINHSGVGNVGRQTAQGLFNLCTPVSKADMQPGDLIFFTGTYSSPNPVTHVGIYVGGGRMIHCGSPISYANINSSYWVSKFYSGGRLP